MKTMTLNEAAEMIDNYHEKAGLKKEILSKLVFEDDEADSSSVCGTVYISKSRMLIFQFKTWNEKPYVDIRMWFKDDDGNFRPTRKGIMIPQTQEDSNGTHLPFNDFCDVFDTIRTLSFGSHNPTEEEIDLLSSKEKELNNFMIEGLKNREQTTT